MRRPAIPLSVRVAVSKRQVIEAGAQPSEAKRLPDQLAENLATLGLDRPELDHSPALVLRPYNSKTRKYHPDANDPDFLVYLSREDHLRKTVGRLPGAEKTVTTKGSDAWIAARFRKIEGKLKPKVKTKIVGRKTWPSRPFNRSGK